MSPELLIAATFVGVLLLVVGPYYLFVVRGETADQDFLRQRIRTGGAGTRVSATGSLLKEVERFSTIGPLNRMLGSEGRFATNLRDAIQMSGLKITPGQLVLGSACLALFVYVLMTLRTGLPVIGAVVAMMVLFLPYGVVIFMRNRRLSKFEEQFPETVDLIARTLRAGHAFHTGLGMVAQELPEPVSTHLSRSSINKIRSASNER